MERTNSNSLDLRLNTQPIQFTERDRSSRDGSREIEINRINPNTERFDKNVPISQSLANSSRRNEMQRLHGTQKPLLPHSSSANNLCQ